MIIFRRNINKFFMKRPCKINLKLQRSYCKAKYFFELPIYYANCFHLANASFHDNVNWYFYNAVEKAFNKLVEDRQKSNILNQNAEQDIRNVLRMMEYCANFLDVRYPIKRDTGNIEFIKGYSIQHGNQHPIFLGGARFGSDLEKPHIRGLATIATFKHALVNVPFCGACCGIVINPKDYSVNELNQALSIFTAWLTHKGFIGSKVSIYEPDVNCNSTILETIADEYSIINGSNDTYSQSCVTGKSEGKNGLKNFDNYVATGMIHGITNLLTNKKVMKKLRMNFKDGWKDKTFIIQGFGKIGMKLAEMACNLGGKCIGVCEKELSYFSRKGLNMEALIKHKETYGNLDTFGIQKDIKKTMAQKCDILLVCSMQKSIMFFNAPDINAKIIIEIATGAVTPSAHKILLGKGKLIIPDVYTNAVSSIVSSLEYSQNTKQENLVPSIMKTAIGGNTSFTFQGKEIHKEDVVTPTVQQTMRGVEEKILEKAEEFKLDLDIRTAAYIIAIENIIKSSYENINVKKTN